MKGQAMVCAALPVCWAARCAAPIEFCAPALATLAPGARR